MGNTKTTIEINGKRYDAVTGHLISENTARQTPHTVKAQQTNQNMDGFFKQPATKPKPSVSRQQKPVLHPHKPARPKTLMRNVVKKPTIKPAAQAKQKAESTPSITVPGHISEARLHRATKISKNPLISRFGGSDHPSVVKKIAPLSVTPTPEIPETHNHHTAAITAPNHIESALQKASSHKQAKHTRASRRQRVAKKLGVTPRFVSISAACLAVLLLGGFIAYQNVPNFAMRMAATRAGFNAGMPGYYPSGFSMRGPIQVEQGQVTINFKSNSDARAFAVTQKSSDWTSETLLSNFVASNNQPYTTYQDKGRTIYIYDGSNATWVNGGVWYKIEGKSSLTSDQLLHIANSM